MYHSGDKFLVCQSKYLAINFSMILFYLFVFIFGLIIGSFLNVVICRLESGEKIINDRSRCPHCRHNLAWRDLIPVLSFIFLKGKCRYCKRPISWQYPMVEIATAIIFILIFNFQFSIFNEFSISNFQFLFSLSFYLFVASVFIIIFVYDLKHYIIPDKIIYPAIIVTLGFNLFNNFQFPISNFQSILNSQFSNFLFSAIIAGAFFLSIVIITKGKGMGGGDIKLAFLMGLILGWPLIIVAVFSAFILGSIIGIFLILLGKKKMKSMVPFGPFLVAGTFIALFWGGGIIEYYIAILLNC